MRLEPSPRRKEDALMKFNVLVATGALLLGLAPYAAAQSLATPATVSAPEPLTGLVLGLGLIGLRYLRRR
jgi:hypothetical protein